MGEAFDPSQFQLVPVNVGVVSSYIFVCVANEASDFVNFSERFRPYVAPCDPEVWRVAHTSVNVEQGNWKLVFENNRECFHCSANHSELLRSYEENPSGGGSEIDNDLELVAFLDACEGAGFKSRCDLDEDGQFRITRLSLIHNAQSFTMDGNSITKMNLLDSYGLSHLGALMMFHYPNTWNHWLCDYALIFRMLPLKKDRTEVITR